MHLEVKLTSPIQVNDTIVLTGVFMRRQAAFKLQSNISFCVPLSISFITKKKKVKLLNTFVQVVKYNF